MSIKGIVGEFDGECAFYQCSILCADTPLTCLAVFAPPVLTVMERELEKIQKNAAAVVANTSVPEEAKREISTSVEVGLTEQPYMYVHRSLPSLHGGSLCVYVCSTTSDCNNGKLLLLRRPSWSNTEQS